MSAAAAAAATVVEGVMKQHSSLVTPALVRGLLSRFTNASPFFASPQMELQQQQQQQVLLPLKKKPNTFRPMQYFPNFPLILRKSEKAAKTPGGSRKVAFQTTPNFTKIEIKNFLSDVYDFNVQKVNTLNVEQRRQPRRSRDANLSRPWTSIHTYKKAIVTMFPSAPAPLEVKALPHLRRMISLMDQKDDQPQPSSSSSSSTRGRLLSSYEGTTRQTRKQVVVEYKKELRVARELQRKGLLQKFVNAAEQNNERLTKKLFDHILSSSRTLLRLPAKKSGRKWWSIRRH
eukprot:TRINITY_DN7443_c0_g1_i1.p1 TRINITY_DN7443_c0_g1~~TRINITY_DN7443_c0_g1_i1.p1  ORF type:complete len:315 (+),score=73.98 TRINITY_DN7443_c0_g1_i1:84-947(+)